MSGNIRRKRNPRFSGQGNRVGRGRGSGRGNRHGRPLKADDLIAGVEIVKMIKKLALPLFAVISSDIKKPDGLINTKVKNLLNKFPFKIHLTPEEMETIDIEEQNNTKTLPPLKIEATSKPVED